MCGVHVYVCMYVCLCGGDVCLLVRIHTCHHALITHFGEGVAYKEAYTYVYIRAHIQWGGGGQGRSKLNSFLKLLIWDQRSQLGQGCVHECLFLSCIQAYIYTPIQVTCPFVLVHIVRIGAVNLYREEMILCAVYIYGLHVGSTPIG